MAGPCWHERVPHSLRGHRVRSSVCVTLAGPFFHEAGAAAASVPSPRKLLLFPCSFRHKFGSSKGTPFDFLSVQREGRFLLAWKERQCCVLELLHGSNPLPSAGYIPCNVIGASGVSCTLSDAANVSTELHSRNRDGSLSRASAQGQSSIEPALQGPTENKGCHTEAGKSGGCFCGISSAGGRLLSRRKKSELEDTQNPVVELKNDGHACRQSLAGEVASCEDFDGEPEVAGNTEQRQLSDVGADGRELVRGRRAKPKVVEHVRSCACLCVCCWFFCCPLFLFPSFSISACARSLSSSARPDRVVGASGGTHRLTFAGFPACLCRACSGCSSAPRAATSELLAFAVTLGAASRRQVRS